MALKSASRSSRALSMTTLTSSLRSARRWTTSSPFMPGMVMSRSNTQPGFSATLFRASSPLVTSATTT